ncbi:HEPN domain-containing protein [Thalassomonas viridans]|uniref:HEPN domain-containing protein n=1 Tax=Thalassomonas viridans TaxID=137584 RepID=A0AAE9YYF6_9GAMM|nr:HEPN domain-containing protein [Thalassomonas viridans]WDE03531.1 HEPN domain-containing protein [Thalassomonas viridans]
MKSEYAPPHVGRAGLNVCFRRVLLLSAKPLLSTKIDLFYHWHMKTSIAHLPEHKQQELQRAVEIIREEIDLELLILFGSYARGDWVEDLDPDTLQYRYQSDFDLMIITETLQQANKVESNHKLEQRLMKSIHRTPISLIAEDIQFVNKRLRKSQYFYIDVQREGVVLFDSGKFELAEPCEITAHERKILAEEDFEYWFNQAKICFVGFNDALNHGHLNKAAFELHQTTERLYGAILLVYTRYKPSSHDLTKLAKRVASAEPQFLNVFPQGTAEEKARFKLLRKAYVDARYKPSYSITKEQLNWLAERVELLQALTEKLCKEKITSFG